VLDFEATCWNDEHKDNSIKTKYKQEIIEFPSVLYELTMDGEVKYIEEFSKYVRPVLEPMLSKFCTELTGITQDKVDSAEPIEIVYEQHHQWLNSNTRLGDPIYIITCGAWDLDIMLPKEVHNKNLPYYSVYKRFINIKTEFENVYKVKAGGMVNMLNYLNIPLEGRHHSGIDDTRNIAKILLKIISDGHVNFDITQKTINDKNKDDKKRIQIKNNKNKNRK
jgi:inhibitor of KinA sporulation pathway (predicted exonuclease)